MYRAIIIIFVFVLTGFQTRVYGSDAKPVTLKIKTAVRVDSSKIKVRQFDTAAMDKFRHDPDFKYEDNAPAAESWWDRFWDWVWRKIDKLFGGGGRQTKTGAAPFFVKYVAIGLIVALLIYIIIKILGVENIFKADPGSVNVAFTESLENIHQINFDEAIDNAVSVKDYRLAVRLLYLRSLKQLSDANLINWRGEKTNSVYLNELKNDNQRKNFFIITRQFEFVWYGEFLIDAQSYQNINQFFQEFKDSLK